MRLTILSLIAFIIFSTPFLIWPNLRIPAPVAPIEPTLISSEKLADSVNRLRQDNQLSSLPRGNKTCLMADKALANEKIDSDLLSQFCPECQSIQIARFIQPVDLDLLQTNASLSASLLDSDLTHLCVATSSSQAVLALVSAKTQSPLVSQLPNSFTEDELWQALTIYRHSQGRTQLQKDNNLCLYARKRVQDHVNLLNQNLNPQDYPVESKYPLDAHQGFKADGDSGLLFEITQKSQLAENLAYWPNALDPIHIIEWGWDTSTEGHREAQTSNDWTSACLSGGSGFYVAIFGK